MEVDGKSVTDAQILDALSVEVASRKDKKGNLAKAVVSRADGSKKNLKMPLKILVDDDGELNAMQDRVNRLFDGNHN